MASKKEETGLFPNTPSDNEFHEYMRPSVAELVLLLRGEQPLPHRIRIWLAELLAQDGDTPTRLVPTMRTPGRSAARDFERRWNVYEFLAQRVDEGVKLEAAISEAGTKFTLKRAAIIAIWSQNKKRLEAASKACGRTVADIMADELSISRLGLKL